MGIKVKGISQAKKHLNDVINDVKGRKVIRALQSAMMLIGARAAYYTPIDTSTLINSQFREIDAGGVSSPGASVTQPTMLRMCTKRQES
jgi:hypothetical protein